MLPRFILHPLLFLLSGGFLLWFVWTGFPTPAGDKPADRSALPDPGKMARITGVTTDGVLQLDSDNSIWRLDDERFHNMTPEQTARVNALFVGKLILLPNSDDNSVRLPIELYDPLCFKDPPPRNTACPIVVKP